MSIDFLVAKSLSHLSSLVIEKVFASSTKIIDTDFWGKLDTLDCAKDLNDTSTLLDYLRSEKGIQLKITPIGYNGGWQCDRIDPEAASHPVSAQGNTIAIAVCLAALRACGHLAVLDVK